MQPGPISEAVLPLKWLLGTWKSIFAKGIFPTIADFTFCDMLIFTTIGQPMLNYKAVSWHPKSGKPMHLESGHLRINSRDRSHVSFLVAHNFGLCTVEEGTVCNNDLSLQTICVAPMTFIKGPRILKLVRRYWLNSEDCTLQYCLDMETDRTPLTNHLQVIYKRQAECE